MHGGNSRRGSIEFQGHVGHAANDGHGDARGRVRLAHSNGQGEAWLVGIDHLHVVRREFRGTDLDVLQDVVDEVLHSRAVDLRSEREILGLRYGNTVRRLHIEEKNERMGDDRILTRAENSIGVELIRVQSSFAGQVQPLRLLRMNDVRIERRAGRLRRDRAEHVDGSDRGECDQQTDAAKKKHDCWCEASLILKYTVAAGLYIAVRCDGDKRATIEIRTVSATQRRCPGGRAPCE